MSNNLDASNIKCYMNKMDPIWSKLLFKKLYTNTKQQF